jgi:hypothetical protein
MFKLKINLSKIIKIILLVSIFQSQIAHAATQKDGCEGFGSMYSYIASERDKSRSQPSILKEILEKTDMNASFAKNMVVSVFLEFKNITPDAMEYVTFRYCMENPSILTQALR